MTPTVTLETKCWEQDWRRILDGERLRLLAERNTYPFSEKILMINNVKNISVVTKFAERAVQQGWLTKYINVEEHAGEVLDFFSISRESLGAGYPYSIAELVGLFLCRSDFLLHYAGDCIPAATSDWVPKAVQLMSVDPRVKVCSLDWDENHREARGRRSRGNGQLPPWNRFFRSMLFGARRGFSPAHLQRNPSRLRALSEIWRRTF